MVKKRSCELNVNKADNISLGKLVVSATGLRRMASALQKRYKTKGDVELKHFITCWKVKSKIKRTLGIEL